jgi:hypothetical protein
MTPTHAYVSLYTTVATAATVDVDSAPPSEASQLAALIRAQDRPTAWDLLCLARATARSCGSAVTLRATLGVTA